MTLAYLFTESGLTPWKENVNAETLSYLVSQTPIDIESKIIHFDGFTDEMVAILSQFDLVFNLCYGFHNAGQVEVAGWLDYHNIPHTASSQPALKKAQNKALLPDICARVGLHTPALYNINGTIPPNDLFLAKPRKGSCHRNIHINTLDWFKNNLHLFDDDLILQPYIFGREFSVAVLPTSGGKTYDALPPVEIVSSTQSEVYIAGQSFGPTNRDFTPLIDEDTTDRLMQAAIDLHNAIKLSGMSRTDFRVDHHGQIYVLDVNAMPNLDPQKSLLPTLCAHHHLSMTEVIERMIENHSYTKQIQTNQQIMEFYM